MKIKEIVSALERFAPLPLQDGFDNSGLQIGITEMEATRALLCLDVTEAVIDEAINKGCNVIISHHPLIFKGYKSLTGKDYIERSIMKAIQHNIVLYAAHTNLDNVSGGVSYKMAEKIGLKDVRILDAKNDMLYKLVTYVPVDYAERLKSALFAAGCGNIGAYDACSFQSTGLGAFRPSKKSNPFCGTIGAIHQEKETKIEVVLPVYKKESATRALLEAHPYEEPAYDFYTLKNQWNQVGSGAIGELSIAEDKGSFLRRIKEIFGVSCLLHNEWIGSRVVKVALCGGSGAFLREKAIAEGADVFITGEIHYHDFFGYEDRILLAAIGHYESEQFTKEIFKSIIENQCPGLDVYTSELNTNPIKFL
ncbi:MAG: Nif3-like dinuclear metal center hexameric protein [Bacteroidaceae bacterium]